MSFDSPNLYEKTPGIIQKSQPPPLPERRPDSSRDLPSSEQAQAELSRNQSIDISQRVLQSFWEMFDRRTQPEFERLQKESERIQKHEAALKKQEEEAATKLITAEKMEIEAKAALDLASAEKEEASRALAEAKRIAAENEAKESRVNQLLRKEQEIKDQEKNAKLARQEAENDLNAAKVERESAEATFNQNRQLKEQISSLRSQSWPFCLNNDPWDKWQKDLLEKANQDANAALLVAAFHRFCAALKSADPTEVYNALQDLGKRLYAATNDPEFVARIGTAFNETSENKFKLNFALPGQPTVDQWMNYQPGLGSVRQVRNWAVYKPGTSGFQIASKADVV